MGLFENLKKGLQRTTALLRTDVRDLFKAGEILDEQKLEQFEARLIRTDIGVAAAAEIVQRLRTQHLGRTVVIADIWQTVKETLKELLRGNDNVTYDVNNPLSPLRFATDGPTVILVAGVNGAGKTTSIAKLAKLLKDSGKSVILAAGDTYRAAAVEQLALWSQRIGCEIVTQPSGSDPASVAHIGCERALATGADVLIVDTAGRLQTQKNLMDQLGKIHRVIEKKIPNAPHESLLVIDATTGQNGISQARNFSEASRCTGIILAKLDGTAKGGVVVAIRQTMGLPVKYVGVGEKLDDLELFDPDSFVDALVAE
ncbi:MAG: signal recognition particle-docking protein FtsY [Planctomycetaceae bacterium]